MAAYVVLDVEVQDPKQYEKYKALAPQAIAAYGGRYLARGGVTETVEGRWTPSRLVLLEFPTMERARAWWGSQQTGLARATAKGFSLRHTHPQAGEDRWRSRALWTR